MCVRNNDLKFLMVISNFNKFIYGVFIYMINVLGKIKVV